MTDQPEAPHCLTCKDPVTFADLRLLNKRPTGEVVAIWECSCGTQRYKGFMREDVYRQLLGPFRPVLPYTATPVGTLALPKPLELQLTHAEMLLEEVDSAEAFLELCTGTQLDG